MGKTLAIHEGVIRRSLVAELEAFRPPAGGLVSSYYLDLSLHRQGNRDALRILLKEVLGREREQIDQLDVSRAVRQALRRDWELTEELATAVISERNTLALACFSSEADYARALRLPWPIRQRAFFEDRFILWPLRQVLDQADRYGIVLTDKNTPDSSCSSWNRSRRSLMSST
jgi:hypothetical protein